MSASNKARANTDQSLSDLKGLCNKGNKGALEKVDFIIRNTYRTLLSRAMKGCLVYCTDIALSNYLKQKIEDNKKKVNEFYSLMVSSPEVNY